MFSSRDSISEELLEKLLVSIRLLKHLFGIYVDFYVASLRKSGKVGGQNFMNFLKN